MKKVNGQSLNSQEELAKQLKKNFPQVFSEDGRVDPEKLKLTLGEDIELSREKYGLSWAGKSDCFREIQKTTTATLVPQRDESVNFDETENIFIEGENLETLRVLQKSNYGKIKMIYIDPPYNTGNDFVYNDSFKQNKKEYQEQIGETNGNGDLSKDTALRRNTKDSGHYHSNWLNMIYPRLFLARNLLRRDGVIFVSIDDNEVHNLRLVMNEIFGEENFLAQFLWKSRQTTDSRKESRISNDHEYILAYTKQLEEFSAKGNPIDTSKYSNPNNDPRGAWASTNLTVQATKDQRPNQYYDIVDPSTGNVYQQ
jgi:adenine-specific DNA-methyltransferase